MTAAPAAVTTRIVVYSTPDVKRRARMAAAADGFGSLSEWVASLIRVELEGRQ